MSARKQHSGGRRVSRTRLSEGTRVPRHELSGESWMDSGSFMDPTDSSVPGAFSGGIPRLGNQSSRRCLKDLPVVGGCPQKCSMGPYGHSLRVPTNSAFGVLRPLVHQRGIEGCLQGPAHVGGEPDVRSWNPGSTFVDRHVVRPSRRALAPGSLRHVLGSKG